MLSLTVLIDGKLWGRFYNPKIGLKSAHQKVRLCAVDLGDQKVRLRAVWMGRNLGLKLDHFLGSKNQSFFIPFFRAQKSAKAFSIFLIRKFTFEKNRSNR